ncbi:hypothetical protein RF679_10890 [Undibacterium cyanobacteriorum]|uniref:Uncharacterized protein n=1 Tax=Undibacterium cyanobacteriorum TaxID=3073561 RepID=A0ABY9RES1_9BURK|nr:hypothetical protein [Undibacterium sp. 20NA77.5]WMW79155.1 hypothetical protein RF679_10890 [Undibacterium sp. 20NA77.5]
MKLTRKTKLIAGVFSLVLAGCGGFVYTTVGGNVTGLTTGSTLVLKTDTNYTAQLSADGPFSFRVASNASYNITVGLQPNPVNCTVTNGSGQMRGEAPVTNVSVQCSPNVQLGGTLTNLPDSTSVVLAVNSDTSYPTTLSANGPFSFSKYVVDGQAYTVSVVSPPSGKVCVVTNGTGTARLSSPPTNIGVDCVTGVPIGGTISGLKANTLLVLTNNGSDTVNAVVDGVYTFRFSLLDGQGYDVQVSTQPTGQKCTVVNGKGVASLANPAPAAAIAVTCVAG